MRRKATWSIDRTLMIGVVGLGAYAVYRLLRAPGGPSATFDATAPGTAFPTPADFQPPADSTAVLGPLLDLAQGRWYGGRIELGAPDAASGLGPDLVAGLRRYGFSGAVGGGAGPSAPVIYSSAAEATSHVPDYALDRPTAGSRWFSARWSLPTQNRPRPQWLPLLWSARVPRL